MSITPLKHYSIPAKCQNDNTGCPFTVGDYMPKSWENRYTELTLSAGNLLRQDTTGEYTPQGGCTDGTYIYRALVKSDEEYTTLQKIDLNGNLIFEKTNFAYGHANDMTYCAKDGLLYVAHSSSTSIVYKVDPSTLEYVGEVDVGPAIWGIDYNATYGVFILGLVGSAFLSVYTYDFSFIYRIKMQNAFTGMVRQGLSTTDNYIFVALDNAYGTVLGNDTGSRVMVFTWNSMFIKSIHLAIKEIEFVAVQGDNLIIGTYEGRDSNNIKSGDLYKVPFDLYPEQTVLTGRPTDVSGGLNNLQRLPEGTPVRLWKGSATSGDIVFNVPSAINVDEDGPFRYFMIRFKGANQQVFHWYPINNGVACLREVDIVDNVTIIKERTREARLTFNYAGQKFSIDSNVIIEKAYTVATGTTVFTMDQNNAGAIAVAIEVTDVWGVV